MPNADHTNPQEPVDDFEAALGDLLAGPSPVNMVHGAIALDASANGATRPSRGSIDAARGEILAALWGVEP